MRVARQLPVVLRFGYAFAGWTVARRTLSAPAADDAGQRRKSSVSNLLDIRDQPLQCGMSQPLLDRVASVLSRAAAGHAVPEPAWVCAGADCFSWPAGCLTHVCDAQQTVHRASSLLWCHLRALRRVPQACRNVARAICTLARAPNPAGGFPGGVLPLSALIRLDRDATAQGQPRALLDRLRSQAAILVRTQMLAKVYRPRVTWLVSWMRMAGSTAPIPLPAERMAQLLVQVAGRAGRGDRQAMSLIPDALPRPSAAAGLVRPGLSRVRRRRPAGRQSSRTAALRSPGPVACRRDGFGRRYRYFRGTSQGALEGGPSRRGGVGASTSR